MQAYFSLRRDKYVHLLIFTSARADNLFEEVEPAAVLDTRANENGTRDFLVKWPDGAEDSWVRVNTWSPCSPKGLASACAAATQLCMWPSGARRVWHPFVLSSKSVDFRNPHFNAWLSPLWLATFGSRWALRPRFCALLGAECNAHPAL